MLGVIVGGLIAILGSVAVPIIQHVLTDRTRKISEHRANVHAAIVAVAAVDHWLDEYRRAVVHGDGNVAGVPPFSTLEALVRVHFPEAKAELSLLSLAKGDLQLWALQRQAERQRGEPLDMSAWQDITRQLALRKERLIDKVCGSPPTPLPEGWVELEPAWFTLSMNQK